jgi:hypothetical protein
MADGRTKPIAQVRVGDQIYGTVKSGFYRRYELTTVLAHWSTVKPAYKVTLEDGTQLVCSGDHRFLTERGWKHVTGAESGPLQRPFLTVNNKLMGVGGFAEPPKETDAYRALLVPRTPPGRWQSGSPVPACAGRSRGAHQDLRLPRPGGHRVHLQPEIGRTPAHGGDPHQPPG